MNNLVLSLSNTLADAVARAGRAVVAVNARRRGSSTGVHWRPGVVVTADHTVRMDDEITITRPDGRPVPATLAGRDPGTDLAVLTVADAEPPVAELGDADSLKVGHPVLALGAGPTASWGVVSAVSGRWHTWRGGEIDRLLRLDLVLYPGFSGGPLVDLDGRIVGINTSGLSRHTPVAIPVATVSRVSDELLTRGHVARGYLGLALHPVRLPETLAHTVGLASRTGLIVVNVEAGGPSSTAGLLIGDVLVTLDGAPVGETDDVQAVLGSQRVGSTVRAQIIRAGASAQVEITVGDRPQGRR